MPLFLKTQRLLASGMHLFSLMCMRSFCSRRRRHFLAYFGGKKRKSFTMTMFRFTTSLARPASRLYRQQIVWKSSATTSECPVTGGTTTSSSNKNADDGSIQFSRVPALPIVGSMWTSYSGTPKMDESTTYQSWPTLRKTFGDFYAGTYYCILSIFVSKTRYLMHPIVQLEYLD